MGRTLHYRIEKLKGKFTAREQQVFDNVSRAYNSGMFEGVWSCENFWISCSDYSPAWAKWGAGKAESNKQIDTRYNTLAKQNLSHTKIVAQLVKEKLVVYNDENRLSCIRGFTKVQGNELNATLVYTALLEISKRCPAVRIHLEDEGELLFAPVYIQNNKVLPDLACLKQDIERWGYLLAKAHCTELINQDTIKSLTKEARSDLNIGSSYNSCAESYFNKALQKYSRVANILSENWVESYPPYMGNVESLDPKRWFKPEIFCHRVNPADFENYKASAETLMEGFGGVYFGLSNKDEKTESYRRIGQLQKLFGKENLQILKFS